MEQLKKVISLNQAATISGYSQDYLGYLLRKGEIKGRKMGKSWLTTEAEVKNYIFKQKIRRKDYAVREFLSPTRTKRIVLVGFVFLALSLTVWLNFFNAPHVTIASVRTSLTEEADTITDHGLPVR